MKPDGRGNGKPCAIDSAMERQAEALTALLTRDEGQPRPRFQHVAAVARQMSRTLDALERLRAQCPGVCWQEQPLAWLPRIKRPA
jgi:hypothetical protein